MYNVAVNVKNRKEVT